MSKKYFAKYLPVKGEIKEGSKFQAIDSTGKPFYRTVKHTKGPFLANDKNERIEIFAEEYNFKVNYKTSDIKLVKLFLCTRDIKESDDYKLPNELPEDYLQIEYSKSHDGSQGFEQWFYANIKWINTLGLYKILGEISPEATWVKEGDEFNEEEWKFCYGNGNPEIELGKDKVPFDFPYCIKILNPSCKHFH